jgi:hypothetical protein
LTNAINTKSEEMVKEGAKRKEYPYDAKAILGLKAGRPLKRG